MLVPRTPLRGVSTAARRWAARRRWILPAEAMTPERGNGPQRETLSRFGLCNPIRRLG